MARSGFDRWFAINERWLFDQAHNTLNDLDGRGAEVKLTPVAGRLLAVLVRSAGTVVSRRRLFDEGWRQYGAEVGENSLNQVMHSLRMTFGSLDLGHAYVKTIPRIGYCLTATVHVVPAGFAVTGNVPGQLARLVSRASFDGILELQWRRSQETAAPLSMLSIDINGFSGAGEGRWPDTAHVMPDLAARCVMSQLHRPGDLLVPDGSTGLFVLLVNTDISGAQHVARKIRTALTASDLSLLNGCQSAINVAVGVVCTATHLSGSPSRFMEDARLAMRGTSPRATGRSDTRSVSGG